MSPGRRPAPEQLLILHAALDPPARAREAWEAWRVKVDFDEIDRGSLQLLPLVFRNLGPEALDHDVAGRLKGVFRLSWSRNQFLLERAAMAIGRLEGAGIATMAIGGATLALLSYSEPGLRPLEIVALLVPLERADEAIEALSKGGWAPEVESAEGLPGARHSLGFADGAGGRVELRWHANWQPAGETELWRAADELELAGTLTRAPCAADRLLLACVEGTPWNPLPDFPWAADAIATIDAAGQRLDWDRLVVEAGRRKLTPAIAPALRLLAEEFGAAVPAEAIERLEAAPVSRRQRAAYRAARRRAGPLRTLRMVRHRHRLLAELDALPDREGFVSFAQRFWRLDSPWRLPGKAAEALFRRSRGADRSAV
jgi:hypothetical protein